MATAPGKGFPGMVWNGYQWVTNVVQPSPAVANHPDGQLPGSPRTAQPKAMTAKEKLAMLRGLGYKLDKGWGPKGQRAWNNYLLAHKRGLDLEDAGQYWSAHQKGAKPVTRGPAGAGGADAGTDTGPAGQNTPTAGSVLGAQFNDLLAATMKQIINPSMFAMQSANQEYDGSIAGLARQIATNQTQGQQNVRDIGNWYTQAGNQQKTGAQANVALGNNVAQGLENNNSAIVAALGANPDAAAGVGNWNATLAAGLKGDAQATQAFDNQMGGFLAAQGAAAKTSEQNQMQNLAKELQAQRTGLIKEKGQARSKYRAEAEQQRFQQLAAVQNMALGASQMGVDLDLKNAQLKGQGLSNDLDQMKLDYARDQMTESGQDDPSKLPLDSRMKLVQALKGSVTSRGKSGAPMAKPQTLYSRFAAEMGLDTQNAGHRKFLLQVLRSLYPNVQKYPFNFTK